MKNPYFWIYFFTAFAFLGLRNLPEVSTSSYLATQRAVDLDYGGIDFCQAAPTNPIPTFSPAGGTFTAEAGLVVNALTGEINLAASTIGGPYEITYTVGVESANYFVFIVAPPSPAISYPQSQLCMSPTPPPAQRSPSAVSPAGGIFAIAPAAAGLSINSSNGIIGFNSSTPSGTYTITYTVSQGGCVAQSTFVIELAQPAATPTLSYPQASYCPLSPNPSPTFNPAGGAFTASPAGLSINASTGVVNLAASTAGAYTITYTVGNAICGNRTVNFNFTVENTPPDPTLSYAAASFCTNQSPAVINPQGFSPAGGSFSAVPAGLSLNTSTGAIDLAASTPNSYIVTYSVGSGDCAKSTTFAITVNPPPTISSFSYAGTPFCRNDAAPLKNPTIAPALGANETGSFSAAPAGLSLNTGTGEINVSTSTAGTYTITYTVNNTLTGCQTQATTSVEINEVALANLAYSKSTFCSNEANPSPSTLQPAAPAGVFSVAPAGLVINATTGEINLATSTLGTYTITYTVTASGCSSSDDFVLTIAAPPTISSFAYTGTPFCSNDAAPLKNPTIAPALGANETGSFSAAPAGLGLNASTGEINVSTSTAVTYTITYTVNNTLTGCQTQATTSVEINEVALANLAYSKSTFCSNEANPSPSTLQPAAPAGVFSAAPAGLVINATTGEINLSASTLGTYTITYTVTASGCSSSDGFVLTIAAPPTISSFAYTGTPFCRNDASPLKNPTIAPALGANETGSFSAVPTGLGLNATTGEINVSTSTAGTYTITYTVNNTLTGCQTQATTSVEINEVALANLAYSKSTFCSNEANPSPSTLQPAAPAGVFSAAPAGLIINATTGEINLATSTVGTYTITYTVTASGCSSSDDFVLTIAAPPTISSFAYTGTPFCRNDASPLKNPTIAPALGANETGSFSAVPTGLSLNAGTGEINVSTSTAGTYTITYTVNNTLTGCQTQATTSVEIINLTIPTLTYTKAVYCVGEANPLPATVNPVGGVFSTSSPNLVINPGTGEVNLAASTVGAYTITYTITLGTCTEQVNVAFELTNPPVITAFAYAAPFCSGTGTASPSAITPAPGGLGANEVASFSASPAGLVIDANGNINLNNSQPNTYTVVYRISNTASGCFTEQSTSVTVENGNVTLAYPSINICTDEANAAPSAFSPAGGVFSASSANISLDPATGLIDIANSQEGTYTITYTVDLGGACGMVAANFEVLIAAPPVILSISASQTTIFQGESVVLTVETSGADSFDWTPTESLTDANTANPTARPNTTSTYRVAVSNAPGCVSQAEITIEVIPSDFFVPNSFTPNGDGSNDTFRVFGNGVSEINLRIFNRLGTLVYETNDVNEALNIGWDGTNKGQVLEGGSYVWSVSGRFLTGSALSFKGKNTGTVTLIR